MCHSFESLHNFQIVDLAVPLKSKRSDWWRRLIQTNKPTYWLFVTRTNGNLEIYFIPDMKLVYIVNNVGNGNKVNGRGGGGVVSFV